MVTRVVIPPGIKERYMEIILSIDITLVNKYAIMIMISHKLKFITAKYIPIRKNEDILAAMNLINNT